MVPIILPKSGALEMGGAGHGPGMGSPRGDDVDDDGGYAFVLQGFASWCVVWVLLLRGVASECSL